uniref:CSON003895 protein n=2 Tax=Culicoides sonorensis TaxID=179676 RepID=A0A336L4Z3_CULSO
MKSIIIFAVIACVSATPFLECGNGKAPVNVEVEGCDKTPCKLKRGTNVDFHVEFNSDVAAQSLKPKVIAHLNGVQVPYPLPNEFNDACKHLSQGQCPLTQNSPAKYDISFPVQKAFPAVRLTVEYALENENGDRVTCFQVPIQTV